MAAAVRLLVCPHTKCMSGWLSNAAAGCFCVKMLCTDCSWQNYLAAISLMATLHNKLCFSHPPNGDSAGHVMERHVLLILPNRMHAA